jgi:hypothetical protein
MMVRVLRRTIPLFAALLLVFTQFAVTLHACDMQTMDASSMAMQEMGDCMKQMDAMPQPGLCKLHCDQDAQSDQTSLPKLPLPLLVVLLTLDPVLALPLLPRLGVSFPLPALVASSPPSRVRFKSFRT